MTKPAKTKGRAGTANPATSGEQIYKDGKPVGEVLFSGDAAEGSTDGK